jgi:hypothetical protein
VARLKAYEETFHHVIDIKIAFEYGKQKKNKGVL